MLLVFLVLQRTSLVLNGSVKNVTNVNSILNVVSVGCVVRIMCVTSVLEINRVRDDLRRL